MKNLLLLFTAMGLCCMLSAQDVKLTNPNDYIMVQKNGSSTFTRAFGVNANNVMNIGSLDEQISTINIYNKGVGKLMTFAVNGYVGVGTTNPVEKFQVGNSMTFHDGGHKVIGFLFQPSNGGDLDKTKHGAEFRFDPKNGKIRLGISSTVTSAPEARLTITNQGYVGIATSSPREKLSIGNAFQFHDGGHDIIGMLYVPSTGQDLDTKKYSAEIRFDGTNGNLRLGTSSALVGGPSTHMTINRLGKVGIGTMSTGSHKLAVEGSIGAREIKVEVGTWSDFVFEENYDLPSLKEIEAFIQENGHLQGIPSAEEAINEGIYLGEMNAKLLQKIEELTLYTLEQEKKIEKLEAQNANYEALMERVEKLESIKR